MYVAYFVLNTCTCRTKNIYFCCSRSSGTYKRIALILENLTLKRARHIFKQSLLCLQKILKHVWANKLLLAACSRIMIKHIKHYNKQNYHRVQTFVILPVHLTFEEKLKCFHSNILLKLLSILLNVLTALTETKLYFTYKYSNYHYNRLATPLPLIKICNKTYFITVLLVYLYHQ